MPDSLVEMVHVRKSFWKDRLEIRVLDQIELSMIGGEFVGLIGPSGSGKSTLLNLIGGLDVADGGTLRVAGQDLVGLNEDHRTVWRSRTVGFVFQHPHLVPVLTAAENVELSLIVYRMSRHERRRRVSLALDAVGLSDRASHRPAQLSGGQEQRVAIARAIVTDPTLILADEPTGDLDSESAQQVMELLAMLNRRMRKTIVMVTHDPRAVSYASREYRLDKGVLTSANGEWQGSPQDDRR